MAENMENQVQQTEENLSEVLQIMYRRQKFIDDLAEDDTAVFFLLHTDNHSDRAHKCKSLCDQLCICHSQHANSPLRFLFIAL